MSTYTSAADDAREIRKAYKAAGIRASVRSKSYSGGSSIRVTLNSGSYPEAKRIAYGAQRIDRCEYSGEILSGCNRYVFIDLSDDYCYKLGSEIASLVEGQGLNPWEGSPVSVERHRLEYRIVLENGEEYWRPDAPSAMDCLLYTVR